MTSYGSYVWLVCKLLVSVIVLYVIKLLYEYIYLPIRVRIKYSKYENVFMYEKYIPFLGEIAVVKSNEKEKKGKFYHFIQESLQNKNHDIRVTQLAAYTIIDVCSVQALDEFEKLVPNKIDRSLTVGFPLHNIIGGSLAA